MTLTAPIFLLFGLFGLVPLVLHLYHRRKRIVVEFSTNRFFTESIVQSQRRMQLQRLLLMLLRIGACVGLALALSRPVLERLGLVFSAGRRDVCLVLDDSLSMRAADAAVAEGADCRTRFDRARRLAAQALGQLARGDRAAVLTFSGRALGRDGPAGVELSPDPARLVSDLEALEPTLGAGDPFAALAEAVRLFDSPRQRVRLLVVLSDLQSGAWPQSPWPQPREAVPAVLVQVGPPARANLVASSVRLGEATAVAGRPNVLEVRLANHGAATALRGGSPRATAAELVVEMDGKRCARRPVQLAGQSAAVERVPLVFEEEVAPGDSPRRAAPPGGSAPAAVARLRRIRVHLAGPDALPEDNTLFATVETARRLPVLLVHGPLADEPRRSPAFYVRTALGAVVADGSQLPVDMAAEGDLGSAGLQAYRVVVLAGVRSLPATEAERLEKYVEAGGGLLVFLGDGADPDFYNRVLGSADRPRGGIMPATLQGLVTSEGRPEPMHIIQAEWDHAVFERFQGPLRSALAAIDVRRAWRVEPRDAFVLARLDAEVPLVLERAYGRGRVLLVTAPPQPDWTNLPLRRNFIALASRMVSYLAGGGALGADHEVGRELVVAAGAEAARGVRVTRPAPAPTWPAAADAKPGRQVVEARLRAVGARPEAYLDAADVSVPGFYEVAVGAAAGGDAPRVVAVNCPRCESDPEVLDLDLARRFSGRWKVEGVDLAEAPDRTAADTQAALAKVLGSGHMGRGIWDTLMWVVLAALVIEPFLANRVGGRRTRRSRNLERGTRNAGLATESSGSRVPSSDFRVPTSEFRVATAVQLAVLKFDTAGFGLVGWAAIVVGAALVVYAYTRGLRDRGRSARARRVLLGLRLAAIACLLLSLAHPVWIAREPSLEKPAMAVVLDDSLSMSEPAEPGAPGSRYAKALEVWRTDLEPKFRDAFDVHLYDVRGGMLDGAALPAEPKADRSPLAATLDAVRRALRAKDLRGIVLLSDGNETTDRPGPGAPGAAERLGVPVYAVDVARPDPAGTGPLDLSIQAVVANQRALVGNAVKVTVLLAAEGRAEDQNVEVIVSDARVALARKVIRWRGGHLARTADLEFVPKTPGRFTVLVEARCAAPARRGPVPARRDGSGPVPPGAAGIPARRDTGPERDLANNRATFPLVVRAEPLTVFYVDGVLRWEGKFVREALTRDPDLNVVTAVRLAARTAAGKSQGILTKEQLANVDVVILGDIEPEYFAGAELAALRDWVTDRGGGLLLTGGYLSFAPGGFGASPLRPILPVGFIEEGPTQVDVPFTMKLTELGRDHPIFHVTGDRVRDTAVWHALPRLAGCSRIRSIKPGAQVLAVNPDVPGPDGVGGLPVLVVQEVGKGRAMVLAVDTTWKWRTIVGGFTGDTTFYQKFWGQLVRFLATGEDPADARRLFVSTDRSRCRRMEPVEVAVDLKVPRRAGVGPSAAAGAPGVDWRVQAWAVDEEGFSTPLALVSAGRHRYRATVAPGRTGLGPGVAGRLDILALAEPIVPDAVRRDQDHVAHSEVVTVRVERPDLELVRPRPDPQYLSRLAQATGGRFLKPEDLAAWQVATGDPVVTEKVSAAGLWHHPALVTLFFVFLSAEWILRRLSRLA